MIPHYLIKSLSQSFREGRSVPDSFFDQIYPDEVKKVSITHWTPVEVVQKAMNFFKDSSFRILDVGSGCGKFCHVGSMISPQHQFSGVEQRPDLTFISQEIATDLSLGNVTFINANAFDLNWNDFDLLYFFNPFWENHLSASQRIDQSLPVKKEEFSHYINTVILKLSQMKLGTQVITYHGFGGKFPPSYECIHFENAGTDQIKIWLKTK